MPRVQAPTVRFRVEPGDIPPAKVARRLHLTLEQFEERKPRLFARRFPTPDPDTGMYDLEAVDRWRHLRHKELFPELTAEPIESQPEAPKPSMGERFRAAQERRRHG